MEVHVLASGSAGNSILLKMGSANLLIDAGISARRIKAALHSVNTEMEDIDGVLITHEHRDHICGLPVLARRYNLPIFGRPETINAATNIGELPPANCTAIGSSFHIKDVKVQTFNTSHDAADPVGFSFFYKREKCSVATDLGFVTDTVKKALAMSDVLVLEANHDLDMLRQGNYPMFLKQRIMSNRGHLSNVDAGWTLARLPKKAKMQVCLAHISKENNRPELAKETVSSIMAEAGLDLTQFQVHLTYPDVTASVICNIAE